MVWLGLITFGPSCCRCGLQGRERNTTKNTISKNVFAILEPKYRAFVVVGTCACSTLLRGNNNKKTDWRRAGELIAYWMQTYFTSISRECNRKHFVIPLLQIKIELYYLSRLTQINVVVGCAELFTILNYLNFLIYD